MIKINALLLHMLMLLQVFIRMVFGLWENYRDFFISKSPVMRIPTLFRVDKPDLKVALVRFRCYWLFFDFLKRVVYLYNILLNVITQRFS